MDEWLADPQSRGKCKVETMVPLPWRQYQRVVLSRIEMKILLMGSHLFSGSWEIIKQRLVKLQARESQI